MKIFTAIDRYVFRLTIVPMFGVFLLAAWAPFVLFFLLGETVLIRTEE